MSVLQLKPEVHLWPLFPPSPLALSPRGSQCCCLAHVEGAWKVLFLIFCFQLGVVTCLRSLQLRPWMVWTRETPPWKAMFAKVFFLCMAKICVQWWNRLRFGYIVFVCLFAKFLLWQASPEDLSDLGPIYLGWQGSIGPVLQWSWCQLDFQVFNFEEEKRQSIWSSMFEVQISSFLFFSFSLLHTSHSLEILPDPPAEQGQR